MTSLTVGGLDVGFSNDYMALDVVEKGNDEKIRIKHMATWKKFDWLSWKQDMVLKKNKLGIDWIYVDKTNNQSVVMELQALGMNVEGVSFSNTSKYDMIRNATKQIVTGELVMPVLSQIQSQKQKVLATELMTELREQEYRHDTAKVKLAHPQGRHDDLLWALCLALYGVSLKWSCGVSLVEGLSYDDIDRPENPEWRLDRILGNDSRPPRNNDFLDYVAKRLPPGVTVTSVKIIKPGDL